MNKQYIKVTLILLGNPKMKPIPKCPFCNKEFKRISSLDKHLKETRSEIANYSINENKIRRIKSLKEFIK